jgi:hypothetical protein
MSFVASWPFSLRIRKDTAAVLKRLVLVVAVAF